MNLYRTSFQAMSSDNEVQVYAADAVVAERVTQAAIAEVRRIEAKYSRYLPDTIITRINRAAGRDAVRLDEETAGLLGYADSCFKSSGGRFDITSGVLRRAWNFREAIVPSGATLAPLLSLIGWGKVHWSKTEIILPREGMEIDFGGIGKEYAADRAAGICVAQGVHHGLINLGGDIRVIGPHPDGRRWSIGIRHPRRDGVTIASLEIGEGGLATSGDYERFFERNGVRYYHIMDPRTGMPVHHWQSVSVIAPVCIAAGSYSTIAMLLGKRARRFLDAEQLPFLLIGPDGGLSGPLAAHRAVNVVKVDTRG